jgi:NAD(P)-dependent dehydrogenase (short-subunit alcohol dehydrogenase family)
MSEISFAGRSVIVTGAGKGIGREHARDIAARGGLLVVNDWDAASADAVVEEITAAGGTAVASHESVGTPEGGRAIVDKAVDTYGTVEVIIHNAGTVNPAMYEDMTPEMIREQFDVHLFGAFWVTQPAWHILKENGYGRVVLTGSAVGLFGHNAFANYSAAKMGMYGLVRALAFESRHHDINVNLMLPLAETSIMEKVYQEHRDYFHWAYEDLADELAPMFEHGELLAPTVSSRLGVFLASEDCQVTGQAFSGMAGRYAAVVLGVTDGWLAPDATAVRAEDVRDNFDVINDRANFIEPPSMPHEAIAVAKRHGYWAPPSARSAVSDEPHEIISRVLASPS